MHKKLIIGMLMPASSDKDDIPKHEITPALLRKIMIGYYKYYDEIYSERLEEKFESQLKEITSHLSTELKKSRPNFPYLLSKSSAGSDNTTYNNNIHCHAGNYVAIGNSSTTYNSSESSSDSSTFLVGITVSALFILLFQSVFVAYKANKAPLQDSKYWFGCSLLSSTLSVATSCAIICFLSGIMIDNPRSSLGFTNNNWLLTQLTLSVAVMILISSSVISLSISADKLNSQAKLYHKILDTLKDSDNLTPESKNLMLERKQYPPPFLSLLSEKIVNSPLGIFAHSREDYSCEKCRG